jgi:6-phosphofructokinase 1
MGRNAGFLALYSGIAAGADIVLMEEFPYNCSALLKKIEEVYSTKGYCIIVVSEEVEGENGSHSDSGAACCISEFIKIKLKIDTRHVVLGHTQRGGKTSVIDRLLGSSFGVEAINLIDKGDFKRFLGIRNGVVVSEEVGAWRELMNKRVQKNNYMLRMAKSLGIYLGEV